MFVRTKSFANKDGSQRTYLQIVEAQRVEGKVRQRVVCNLGRIEDLQEGELDRLIESLAKFSKKKWVMSQAEGVMAQWSREYGPVLVFRRLWEELKLNKILAKLLAATEIEIDVEEAVFAMVLNRLMEPCSKRALSEWCRDVYRAEFEKLQPHHYYRALDFIAEHKAEIEESLFAQVRNLFNLDLDLVFYDTTSTYFEGPGPEDLAEFGHSKDNRSDRTQIIVGLLMTRDGMPVAHQVFPGNTADVDTFKTAIEDLQKRFSIRRVILVGDRGMVSAKTLKALEESGYEYIVGVRMRKLKIADEVLSRAGRYKKVADNLQVKEVVHGGVRYVVCLNPEEVERDAKVREAMVEKLSKKLQEDGLKSLVSNRGYRQYLKIDGAKASIDEEKLKQEARYDGKYILRTNNEKLSPEEIALAYKGLWQVERAFRELKSTLDLRPMYHWTQARVRAHVFVCFLAFVLESALRRRLKDQGSKGAYASVIRDLSRVKAVRLTLEGANYIVRTELTGDAYEAFRVVGLRPPAQVQPVA